MSQVRKLIAAVLVIWFVALSSPASAHTLGIDPAKLLEGANGGYALVAQVPPSIAPAIRTPSLPERCTFVGSPRGTRGLAEVRYEFTCATPLNATDKLELPWQREGVLLTVAWADGSTASHLVPRVGGAIVVDLARFRAGSGSWIAAAQRYLRLGVKHILLGIDHLLFIFGLMLLVRNGWMLVKTITSFTIAHSITLGLATLGVVEAPGAPVEAAIALSIVFVGAEAIHARHGHPGLAARRPWIVAFGFGLLHGFGFAGALSAIGLAPGEIPIALLFFNIGVELGQLGFVAVVLGIWWSVRALQTPLSRSLQDIPAYLVGTFATYWFVERSLPIFGG